MAKKNCLVCGKEFEACNSCSDTVSERLQWRRVVCCPEHFLYHEPIILYVRKKISKSEASKALRKAIEEYGNIEFVEGIKPIVNEILAADKPKAIEGTKPQEVTAEPETEKVTARPSRGSRRIRYNKTDD